LVLICGTKLQLINHGVPEEVIENFRSNIIEFFSLPLDAKKEYSQLPNSLEGYGQTFVFSEDQKLDWGDMLYLQVHPTDSRDLRFWPVTLHLSGDLPKVVQLTF
jgi:isopenicillin N synthase-like dioxygenase